MPPRWRLPLLVLGFFSLAFGVAGGLARLEPSLGVAGNAIAFHGPLMVSAFFGTVISLERAAAKAVMPPDRISRANPKSSTFTRPSGVMTMLAGLMSRWMMPARWE